MLTRIHGNALWIRWNYLPNLICRTRMETAIEKRISCVPFIVRLPSIEHYRAQNELSKQWISFSAPFLQFRVLSSSFCCSYFAFRRFFCVQRNLKISSHTRIANRISRRTTSLTKQCESYSLEDTMLEAVKNRCYARNLSINFTMVKMVPFCWLEKKKSTRIDKTSID